MKLIDRYEFTNDKSFEIYHLNSLDQQRAELPECDVLAFTYNDRRHVARLAMRPDEALILARLLINAVYQVTEGYATDRPKDADDAEEKPLASDLVEELESNP